MQKKIQEKIDYKWVIVAISFIMIFVCLGFSSRSIYLSAITKALNIKRSLFSINDSFRFIATAIINLFFGKLVSKYGARKLIAMGFVSLIVSMLIYAYATNIFLFYIGGCFLGIGFGWTSTTMVGYVMNTWCKEHKGTIMGFVLAANGVGNAFATQLMTPIIYQEGNAFGYQQAYKIVAIILSVTGILVVSLFRNAPACIQAPASKNAKKTMGWQGITFQQALKKPYFYTGLISIFLTGAALQGVQGVSAAHMTDVGMPVGYMATVVSVQALILSVAKLLAGISNDRFGLRRTVLFCDIAAIVAFVSLALVAPSTQGKSFAMMFGVFSSLALPLETIMLPLLAEEIFGQRSFAQMLGIFVAVNTAGYAVGAPVVNLVYDLCGTYKPVLIVLAVIMILVAIELQRVLRVVKKEKAEAYE